MGKKKVEEAVVKRKSTKKYSTDQLQYIPDLIKEKGEEAISYYLAWLKKDKEIKEHPMRYQLYHKPDGTIDHVDCIQSPPHIKKKIGHLKETDIKEYNRIMGVWRSFFQMKSQKGALRKKWDAISYSRKATTTFYDIHKQELLILFGSWKSIGEVSEQIYTKYQFNPSNERLKVFFRENNEEINRLRDEWSKSYDDFDIAHKRGRLEKLAYIVKIMFDKFKNTNKLEYSKELRATIDQIRNEVEGQKINIDFNGKIDVTNTMNINLTIQQLTRRANINSMIVAQVAAKKGISPLLLMNKLMTSYYSSQNTLNGKPSEIMDVKYPSDFIYDWNDIENKRDNNKIIDADVTPIEEVSVSQENVDLKNNILDLINSRKQKIKQ